MNASNPEAKIDGGRRMRGFLTRLRGLLVGLAPSESASLYRFCRAYVDEYNGDNNDDMATNGEALFLKSILPRARLVMDIGANVGVWARLALGINETLSLHCFEPSRPTFQQLLANGFPPQVICNNIALGSVAGDAQLRVFADGSGMNSLYQRAGLGPGWGIEGATVEEGIHVETLDGYLDRLALTDTIDLCKIDVEGHELEVLRGMARTLQRRQVMAIQFEYGGCNLDSRAFLEDIFVFLQPFGYRLHKIHAGGIRYVPRYDRRLENFQYQNWAAILGDANG